MDTIEYIKKGIEDLYKNAPDIHISVKLSHSKIQIEGVSAKIIGVYKNLFQIEGEDNGHTVKHTYKYNDVICGQVKIEELTIPQTVSTLKK